MTRKILTALAAAIITISLTWFAIENTMLAAVGAVTLIAIVSLTKITGWWRRVYALTILAMFAGASHFEVLSTIGSLGKILSLGLLAVVTFAAAKDENPAYANSTHKLAISALWITVALALLSILWSTNRNETLLQSLSFAAFVYIVHKVSVVRWSDRETMIGDISVAYWVSFTALAIGAVLALAGVPGAVSGFSGRYLGVLSNPNLLGIVAAITLAIGVGVATQRNHPLIWVSLLIPLSQVLLSQSRTAIVAVVIGLIWVTIRGGAVRWIVVGFAVATATVASIAFSVNPFGNTLSRFGERQGGDVLNARTQAWGDVMSLIQVEPLGTGWSTTASTLSEMNQAGLASGLSSVHNSYFQVLLELGWLGALPTVLMIVIFLIVVLQGKINGIGAGLVSATLAGSIIHFTESAMFGIGQPYPYLFWFAVLAAVVNTGESKSGEFKPPKKARFHSGRPKKQGVRSS